MHFNTLLSLLLYLLKAIKKIRNLKFKPVPRGNNEPSLGRKVATFQFLYRSTEQVAVRRGEIRRIGWTIKVLEAQVSQCLLGFKWPVSRAIFMQEQDTFVKIPGWFFLQNVIQLTHLKFVILRVDSLTLWKIIIEENCVLISKI